MEHSNYLKLNQVKALTWRKDAYLLTIFRIRMIPIIAAIIIIINYFDILNPRLEGFVLLWKRGGRTIALGSQLLDTADPR